MRTSGIWSAPVLPGRSEGWRRFCQALMASRRREYAASRQRLGIHRERSWLVSTGHGQVAVVCWEGTGRQRAWEALLASQRPFDRWFRQQLKRYLDLSAAHPPAAIEGERLYCWQAPDD